MTQFEHNIIAGIVFIVLWNLILKHYLVTEKNISDWEEFFDHIFRRH